MFGITARAVRAAILAVHRRLLRYHCRLLPSGCSAHGAVQPMLGGYAEER